MSTRLLLQFVMIACCNVIVFHAHSADANESDDISKIPRLKQHSWDTLTLYQGDLLSLSVKAEGEELLYRWVRNYKTICRKDTCEFDTAKWGVGRQNLTMVIYNQYGSRSVTYRLRLLPKPMNRTSEVITPKMVQASQVEALEKDEFFIRALSGIGYAYGNADVKVVGKVARKLSWTEQVRTHPKGVVHFGIKDQEEMVLMPSGKALLSKSESGQRAVILQSGVLRVRQISPARPLWTILVDDWVQVDGDMKADIVIDRRNATQTSVTVLRGNARIFYRKTIDQPLDQVDKVVVPVGVTVDIEQGYNPSEYRLPISESFENVVKISSPQYFLKSKASTVSRKGMFLSPNIEAHKGKGLSETMIDADKLLKQEDYLMALENLLPVYEKAAGNFLYNIAVADAYRGLHLFKPAMHFYNAASAANRNSGLPDFEMGLLFIAQKKWADAEASFKSAKDKGYANKQMLNYYLGVSQYNQGDALGAEIAFKASLWESKNSDLKESAQAFLQGLGDDNAVGAIGTAGIGYDSNPYRWGKGSRTDNYRTKAGALYRGFGSVFYRPKDDAYGHFKLAFDIEKKGFFESDLENIETLSQKLYVDWKANFFLDENLQSALSVRLVPFLELFSFGENRSADKYGAHVEVGNESWVWAPRLLIGYTFLVDPLPGRDDKLDPILLEPIQPSDRSAVITNFGLGFRLVRQPDLFADLLGSYITVGQRNELIEIDDFNEINIRVEAEHILNQYIHLSLTPGYFNRTFPNSRDSRKDSGYLLDLGLSYYFTQAFYHDFKAHYRNQDSNRNVSSYNQYYATANFTLEL